MGLIEERYVSGRQESEAAALDRWLMAEAPTAEAPSPEVTPRLQLDLGEGEPGEVPSFGAPLPPPEGALPVPPLTPRETTPEELPRGILGDIGAGIAEAPQQILGGARDALANFLRGLEDLQEWTTQRSESKQGNVQSRPTVKLSEGLP